MTQSSGFRLRSLAKPLAYTGGGITALGGGLFGVLLAESKIARRQIGDADDVPPAPSGWYGHGRPGPALKIALLGDSSAAGYGVDAVQDTPGAYLASGVAEAADRRGHLSSGGTGGGQAKEPTPQIDPGPPKEARGGGLFIGRKDVTHAVPHKNPPGPLRAAGSPPERHRG